MPLIATDTQQVFLKYNNKEKIGFDLQEVQGVLQYFPGIAPQIVDQQHSGPYGYDALPAQISSPISFESWHRGAGFRTADELLDAEPLSVHGLAVHGYSYSRGINASYEDRLYRSFARQAFGTPASDAPSMYLQTKEFGYMRASGTKLYHYNAGAWDLVETFAVAVTDMIEYGNTTDTYLVVALGDANNAQYSTDGTTFAAADKAGTYLTQAGITSTEPVLWMITAGGRLRSSVTVSVFSNADVIGSASDLTTGLVTLAETKVILKDVGLYVFDGTTVKTIIEDPTFRRTTNGTQHVIYFGKLYFNFMGRIVEYDIAQDSVRTVFMPHHPEINGAITAMTANATHLFFAIKNLDSVTYIIKLALTGDGENPWHTIAYLGANDCNTMAFAASPTVHASNPVLVIGYSTTDKYFIEPRDGMLPEDDTNVQYDTDDGVLYGPKVNGGTLNFTKFFNGTRAVTEYMDTTEVVTVAYQIDNESTWTDTLEVTEAGSFDSRVDDSVEYTTLAYRITMESGVATRSARMQGILFDSTPNPPRRDMWSFVVEIGPASGGSTPRNNPQAREQFLLSTVGQRATFTDYWGVEHNVLVLEVKSLGYQQVIIGQARRAVAAYAVTLVEV